MNSTPMLLNACWKIILYDKKKHLFIFFLSTFLLIIILIAQSGKHVTKGKKELNNRNNEWVILLHGIMKNPATMRPIEKALNDKGYSVINFGYPSTSEKIEAISDLLHDRIKELPDSKIAVHFVTHSLGSIVVRYYLAHHLMPQLGKIVMIAPPNKGSIVAEYLKGWPPYKWFMGEAGQQLARGPNSLPNILPVPKCEFGIIAGGKGNDFGFNPLIPGDDDMTVSVEETKLTGMKDFIQIKGQHTLLLWKKEVILNVLSFLENSTFLHKKDSS